MKLLRTAWLYLRWPLAVLAVFYIFIVIYRIPAVGEKQRTEETVAKIQAQKITLSDVNGTALPPMPNSEENNATVEGIDKNNNGIRDDVELAIFRLHPDSAKIRAAELQYAMNQQIFLTAVFNADTWVAAAKQDSRGFACIGETIPNKDLNALNSRVDEVRKLVLNTETRKSTWENAYKFTTSYGDSNEKNCDIDLESLPN